MGHLFPNSSHRLARAFISLLTQLLPPLSLAACIVCSTWPLRQPSIRSSTRLFCSSTSRTPFRLLVRGRSLLPQRYLSLGIIGYIFNIFSVLWIVLLGVLVCMPPNLPIALGSMNYICVILVGVFIVINCLWFAIGRKSFEGPCIDWGMMRTG